MIKLTHNDYFTTTGTGLSWKVHINKCTKKHIEDFHNELVNAAKIIYDQADSKIILMFSGGLDSEYMLNIFKKAKIPFDVAIISYGKYNDHDTKYAYDYCNNHNITPTIVDVDIDSFIKSGKISEIANSVKCCAYQMPSMMYGLTKLDGTIIMASGEPYIKNFDGIWRYEETERVNSYMRWFEKNNIEGTPDFLRYTPEATLAFLKEPRVIDLVNNKIPGKLSTRTSKHSIYSKNYTLEPRPKFTGWEKIEETDLMKEDVFSVFEDLRNNHNGVFELKVNELEDILKAS